MFLSKFWKSAPWLIKVSTVLFVVAGVQMVYLAVAPVPYRVMGMVPAELASESAVAVQVTVTDTANILKAPIIKVVNSVPVVEGKFDATVTPDWFSAPASGSVSVCISRVGQPCTISIAARPQPSCESLLATQGVWHWLGFLRDGEQTLDFSSVCGKAVVEENLGVAGAKGDKGDQGVTGVSGRDGAVGQAGVQGIRGVVGTAGIAGTRGGAGQAGAVGAQGVVGVPGSAGVQGLPGVLSVTSDQNITGSLTGQNLNLGWSGVLSAARGGTGMTSIALGGLVVGGTANTLAQLPVGASNQVLTVVGGVPTWLNPATGFADPLTTAGDLNYRDSTNTTTRLPIGTSGQVLTVGAGTLSYQTPTASPVSSVFGRTGVITSASGDYTTTQVGEGTNLYFTNTRADARINALFPAAFDTLLAAKTTDNLVEGSSNLYFTPSRFTAQFVAKTTDDLTEGALNLYFTNARADSRLTTLFPGLFDTRLAAKSTTNLAEGTNLYFTNARADARINALFPAAFDTLLAAKTTDNLVEGSINKYYATSLFNTDFSTKTTTDLAEGTNLYYTGTRFDTAFAAKNTDDLTQGSTNKYYATSLFNTDFGSKTSDDLTEGTSNLYYTQGRFDTAFAAKSTTNLPEGVSLYFSEPRVLNTVLTGLSPIAGTVNATDSLLQAINKLQGTDSIQNTSLATLAVASHPGLTLTGSNGLTLNTSAQILSLGLSSLTTTGSLSASDFATFAAKQNSIIPKAVTAGSSKILLAGTPAFASLQPFSIDIVEANLSLQNIGGAFSVSQQNTLSFANISGLVNLATQVTGVLPLANLTANIPNINLANSSISLATTSTGLAPMFSAASVALGGTATLSIPLAFGSGVTSGTISKVDYDYFVAKVSTADNGLTINTPGNVQLGGNLLQNTTIDGSGLTMSFINNEMLQLQANGIEVAGNSNSFAGGQPRQVAIGSGNSLAGTGLTVIGSDNALVGSNSTIIGTDSYWGGVDLSSNTLQFFGRKNNPGSGGLFSDIFSIGTDNQFIGSLGSQSKNFVFGNANTIDASEAFAIGGANTFNIDASNSYTFGFKNYMTAKNAFSIGMGLTTTVDQTIDIGIDDSTKLSLNGNGQLNVQSGLSFGANFGNNGDVLLSAAGGQNQWINPFSSLGLGRPAGQIYVGNSTAAAPQSYATFVYDGVTGRMGLGTPTPNSRLQIANNTVTNATPSLSVGSTINTAITGGLTSNLLTTDFATGGSATGTIIGTAISVNGNNVAGAVQDMIGLNIRVANNGQTIGNSLIGLNFGNSGGSGIPNLAGIVLRDQTGATNASNLVLGLNGIPAGTWSMYNSSTRANFMAGSTLFSGTAATPGNRVEIVQGAAASGTSGLRLTNVGGFIPGTATTTALTVTAAGDVVLQNIGTTSTIPLSSLTAATSTNVIDSGALAQTWNWSTATTQNVLNLNGNSLTTGTLLNLGNTGSFTSGAALNIIAGGGSGIISNTPGSDLTTPAGNTLNVISGTTGVATFDSGTTGAVNLGTSTNAKTVTIGNVTGASALSLRVGTGNLVADGVGASSYAFGASTTNGTFSLGGITQTGVANLFTGTGSMTINLGTGATGAKAINIGTGASANILSIGNATGATSVGITAGTAGVTVSATASAVPALQLNANSITSANALAISATNVGRTGFGLFINASGNNADSINIQDSTNNCTGNPGATFTWTCSSDARLKKNITDSAPVLLSLNTLKIRQYDWLSDGTRASYGVVAQEIEAGPLSDLVTTRADGVKAVRQVDNWMLVKGLQEVSARIDTLSIGTSSDPVLLAGIQAKITRIEQDIADLKIENERVRQENTVLKNRMQTVEERLEKLEQSSAQSSSVAK